MARMRWKIPFNGIIETFYFIEGSRVAMAKARGKKAVSKPTKPAFAADAEVVAGASKSKKTVTGGSQIAGKAKTPQREIADSFSEAVPTAVRKVREGKGTASMAKAPAQKGVTAKSAM